MTQYGRCMHKKTAGKRILRGRCNVGRRQRRSTDAAPENCVARLRMLWRTCRTIISGLLRFCTDFGKDPCFARALALFFSMNEGRASRPKRTRASRLAFPFDFATHDGPRDSGSTNPGSSAVLSSGSEDASSSYKTIQCFCFTRFLTTPKRSSSQKRLSRDISSTGIKKLICNPLPFFELRLLEFVSLEVPPTIARKPPGYHFAGEIAATGRHTPPGQYTNKPARSVIVLCRLPDSCFIVRRTLARKRR